MPGHLEFLIEHQQKNVRKIDTIEKGKYGEGVEGWVIINDILKGVIPVEIRREALRLRREKEELVLKCQIESFYSYKQVRKINDIYGKIVAHYDSTKSFVDNCRTGFRPFPDSDRPVLYLFDEAEDEIAKEAVKQFESTYLVPILIRLNRLYDQAIGFLKGSENSE